MPAADSVELHPSNVSAEISLGVLYITRGLCLFIPSTYNITRKTCVYLKIVAWHKV